jgi:hypothetical protein
MTKSPATPGRGGGGPSDSSSADRSADIWSTRIQRELLALTTDDAEATTEQSRAMLPSFVSVTDHSLDLAAGTCTVSFQVGVTAPPPSSPSSGGREEEEEETYRTAAAVVVVQLDASLRRIRRRRGDAADGNETLAAYPFVEPVATLLSGQQHFPEGSTIHTGDRIGVDIEWTPSLHLADAILNIALKIKESILQSEPFHPAPITPTASSSSAAALSPDNDPSSPLGPLLQEILEPVDEVAKSARRIASSFTSLGRAFGSSQSRGSKQQGPSPATTPSPNAAAGAAHRKKKSKAGKSPAPAASGSSPAPAMNPENVRIGDDIHLLDEPWVDAHGVYACKAIRRPAFISDAMALAEERSEQQSFSSPTAMLRSFTKSARTVLQDSFLMITETHVIEMKSSKLNPTTATVTFCIAIELMHKLKFRRGESLSLFFKPAPDDPLVYMCPDSGDAVHQIQNVLKRHGVRGKHTNAAAHRAIAEALQIIQEIQTKELALRHDPTVIRVNEIMDLYRQAAERFATAGDVRHEEVVTHMRKFLALPLTSSILDGTFQKPHDEADARKARSPVPGGGDVPEGEIIEPSPCQIEDDHDEDGGGGSSKKKERSKSDRAFEESMDTLLKEAEADLQKLKADSGDTLDRSSASEIIPDDVMSADDELAEMMKKADEELAELMKG